MRFTYQEIKKELTDNWQEIADNTDLNQWADGFVPVYNHEIITDWQEMPNEFTDSWKDYGASPDNGIIHLMMIDLYAYYLDQTEKAYEEIKAEDFGTCDECLENYPLADNQNRCGECGNCSNCCTHK